MLAMRCTWQQRWCRCWRWWRCDALGSNDGADVGDDGDALGSNDGADVGDDGDALGDDGDALLAMHLATLAVALYKFVLRWAFWRCWRLAIRLDWFDLIGWKKVNRSHFKRALSSTTGGCCSCCRSKKKKKVRRRRLVFDRRTWRLGSFCSTYAKMHVTRTSRTQSKLLAHLCCEFGYLNWTCIMPVPDPYGVLWVPTMLDHKC